MKYNFYKKAKWAVGLSVMSVALTFSSCKKSNDIFNLDINVDPNNPTKGSVNLLLPEAERNLVGFLSGLSDVQLGFMGVISNSDSYGLGANSFYGSWSYFYTGPGKDIDELIKAARAADNKPYLGIGQALKAYSFSVMVDLFGTLPYKEAFGGNGAVQNINPKFDAGDAIYADCLKTLDSAITNLNAASAVSVTGDIMYS